MGNRENAPRWRVVTGIRRIGAPRSSFDGDGVVELDGLGVTVPGDPSYGRVVRLAIWAVWSLAVAGG
jgi:hypothetical protein